MIFPLVMRLRLLKLEMGYSILLLVKEGQNLAELSGMLIGCYLLLFKGITFSLASQFEVHNRIDTQDSRRILFSKQIELLGLLSPDWATLEITNHQRILQQHPFNDNLQ